VSYCRWSSDDYQCDVYVYEADAGWITHVAGRRRVLPDEVRASWPELPDVSSAEFTAAWIARHQKQREWLNADPQWHDLSYLPSCGKSFADDSAGECADRLEALRAEGFNVPQHAIDALREDSDTVCDRWPPRDTPTREGA
jgi:hypothetical protein